MKEEKVSPRLWAIIMILAAVLTCTGTIVAAAIEIWPDIMKAGTSAATLAPTATPVPPTDTPPTPAPRQIPSPTSMPTPVSTVKSRAEMLVIYDSIYKQQGWCTLWNRLTEDNLVKGSCPSAVLQWGYEDVDTPSGRANLLTGLQMRATEDLETFYPACVTFGVANYTGGTVAPWIHSDYIGTNLTMHADSVFSLFFRCDNAWSP